MSRASTCGDFAALLQIASAECSAECTPRSSSQGLQAHLHDTSGQPTEKQGIVYDNFHPLSWWRKYDLTQSGDASQKGEKSHTRMLREVVTHLPDAQARAFTLELEILHVLTSNSQEGTMPLDTCAQQALTYLHDLHKANVVVPVRIPRASKAQLRNHMRALEYLLKQTVLSVSVLEKTYRILMRNAVSEETGLPLHQGIRTCIVHGGGRLYADPKDNVTSLEEALAKFHARFYAGMHVADAVHLAACLFKWVVHEIHPFCDGNGRLGRLLIAYVLRPCVGFAVPLIDGSDKPRKHYNRVISMMGKCVTRDPADYLASHILECVHCRVARLINTS